MPVVPGPSPAARALCRAAACLVLCGAAAGSADAQVCEAGRRHTLRNAVNCHDAVIAVRVTGPGETTVFDHATEPGDTGLPAFTRAVFTRYTSVVTAVVKAHGAVPDVSATLAIAHRGGDAQQGAQRLFTPTGFGGLAADREYLIFGDFWQELDAFVLDDRDVFELTPSGLTWTMRASLAGLPEVESASPMEGRTIAEAASLVRGLLAELQVRVRRAAERTRALPVVSPAANASLEVYAALVASRCGGARAASGRLLVRRELQPVPDFLAGASLAEAARATGAAAPHGARFARQAEPEIALPEDAADRLGATLVDAADVERLRDGDVFRGLAARYPLAPALVTFSPVVFNDAGTEALVSCGIADASGEFETDVVRVTRGAAGWTVSAARTVERP